MVKTKISLFNNVSHLKSDGDLTITDFLDKIRDGYWQDMVLPIRAEKDPQVRLVMKKSIPNVTLSGLFHERREEGMIVHSGCIGIDIDDVGDTEEMKSIICVDPHVFSAFTSISGTGLCVIFLINGAKHRELFEGIQQYLYERYQVIIDPTSVNISRVRYVSYDPHIYVNEDAQEFKFIPPKSKEESIGNSNKLLFVQEDFDYVLKQIEDQRVDITQGYKTWLKLGFALADKFGEAGRDYWHRISQYHPEYNHRSADRQYTACLKGRASGVTISSFFYYAREAGLRVVTPKTDRIKHIAEELKHEGNSKEEILNYLANEEGISPDDADLIVDHVIENGDEPGKKKPNLIETVTRILRTNYEIRKNCITRKVEVNGKQLDTFIANSIFLEIKTKHSKVSFDLVDRCMHSNITQIYNPFLEWIDKNRHRNVTGLITTLFNTIETDTGGSDYKQLFGRKWIVGIVAAMHGEVVPLMLVLSGIKQNTGKTEWFRRLLPADLQDYYSESKLDMGKDDEILMTQKLIIMDDEMGGKSKVESKRLKELTSKSVFSLREPYGRQNVDLKRLAVLCGTSNDTEILNDPTGNRRIIPINVLSIDHQRYNSIDKSDLLMEAYQLYKNGFEYHLNNDEIKILNDNTSGFESTSREYELFNRYFRAPVELETYDTLTNSEIAMKIEQMSGQRISQHKLGTEMKKMGFIRTRRSIGGKILWVYDIVQKIIS